MVKSHAICVCNVASSCFRSITFGICAIYNQKIEEMGKIIFYCTYECRERRDTQIETA